MVLFFQILVSCICLFSVASGLRCYLEQGFLNQTNLGNLTECFGVAYSCTKSVNYFTGTYLKSCSPTNCTVPTAFDNSHYGPAGCYNTTRMPSSSGEVVPQTATCCCYNDGCNSSPVNSRWIVSVLVTLVPLYLGKLYIH